MIYDMQMNDTYDSSFVDCERQGLYKSLYTLGGMSAQILSIEIFQTIF